MWPLQKLQKRAVRVITLSKYQAHTDPLFTKLRILKISDIYKVQTSVYMYKCKNNLLPVALINSNDFTVRNTLAYNIRNPQQLELPFASHNTRRSSIKFAGPAIWNEMSKNIDFNVINNLTLFTNTIRDWCISNYCNNA